MGNGEKIDLWKQPELEAAHKYLSELAEKPLENLEEKTAEAVPNKDSTSNRKKIYIALCKIFQEAELKDVSDDLMGVWKFTPNEGKIHRFLGDLAIHISSRKLELKDRPQKDFKQAFKLLKKSCVLGEKGIEELDKFGLREEFDWDYFSNIARPNDFIVKNKDRYRLISTF